MADFINETYIRVKCKWTRHGCMVALCEVTQWDYIYGKVMFTLWYGLIMKVSTANRVFMFLLMCVPTAGIASPLS